MSKKNILSLGIALASTQSVFYAMEQKELSKDIKDISGWVKQWVGEKKLINKECNNCIIRTFFRDESFNQYAKNSNISETKTLPSVINGCIKLIENHRQFDAIKAIADKDLQWIKYAEQKCPKHLKIDDLKLVVSYLVRLAANEN